jgi:heparosan-N-sulfate-glucuronate 5-epimerase
MVHSQSPDRDANSRIAGGGFFSSARVFSLQPGERVVPGEVRGYHIDLRTKTQATDWPPEWLDPGDKWVMVVQWGLGAYERFLAGEGEVWFARATDCAAFLLAEQERGGPRDGGWLYRVPFPHTFPLQSPWISAMAQGEGASLLVRLHLETGEERYAEAALRAVRPMSIPSERGGAMAALAGRPYPEEYPTTPGSFVLNGGIFALWGYYDTWLALGDGDAGAAWEDAVETLALNVHRWDTGYWTRYDLYPHPVVNIASSSYHVLHVSQLRAMQRIAPRPSFGEALNRWQGYQESRLCRKRALAEKMVFRLLVPRNRTLATRLPWLRGWGG